MNFCRLFGRSSDREGKLEAEEDAPRFPAPDLGGAANGRDFFSFCATFRCFFSMAFCTAPRFPLAARSSYRAFKSRSFFSAAGVEGQFPPQDGDADAQFFMNHCPFPCFVFSFSDFFTAFNASCSTFCLCSRCTMPSRLRTARSSWCTSCSRSSRKSRGELSRSLRARVRSSLRVASSATCISGRKE